MGSVYAMKGWDCPDTINAAWAYPGFTVVYNGTLVGHLEGGAIVFRGSHAEMRITRDGLAVYPEGVLAAEKTNFPEPVITARSTGDGTVEHVRNFLDCVRSRKAPNAPVSSSVAAANACPALIAAMTSNNLPAEVATRLELISKFVPETNLHVDALRLHEQELAPVRDQYLTTCLADVASGSQPAQYRTFIDAYTRASADGISIGQQILTANAVDPLQAQTLVDDANKLRESAAALPGGTAVVSTPPATTSTIAPTEPATTSTGAGESSSTPATGQ